VNGEYDPRGYLALDGDVRPGFSEPAYTVSVDSDADERTLDEIRAAVEASSPMLDNARGGTPLRGAVVASREGATCRAQGRACDPTVSAWPGGWWWTGGDR
jgi:hypothetical protein